MCEEAFGNERRVQRNVPFTVQGLQRAAGALAVNVDEPSPLKRTHSAGWPCSARACRRNSSPTFNDEHAGPSWMVASPYGGFVMILRQQLRTLRLTRGEHRCQATYWKSVHRAAVGVEIRGIDLAEPIIDETVSTIRHRILRWTMTMAAPRWRRGER
jgi:hypothetical protein